MSRLRLRNDFWNRHGANIASCCKEIYGRRLFRRPKKIHSGERSMLFRCIFIMNGLDDVNGTVCVFQNYHEIICYEIYR